MLGMNRTEFSRYMEIPLRTLESGRQEEEKCRIMYLD